jgi:hypothetical protein
VPVVAGKIGGGIKPNGCGNELGGGVASSDGATCAKVVNNGAI